MKILITGGAGFIGSNLCEYFAQKNYVVVCLDNLSTGFKHNIEPLLNKPTFSFVEGDAIRELVYGRVLRDESDISIVELVEQRSLESNKEMFSSFIKSPERFFGKGYFISSIDYQSTNWRGLFFRFGIVGFIIILFLVISIVKNNNLKYALLLFCIAILIFSHRSWMAYFPLIYMSLYMATVVYRFKINVVKTRNINFKS